MQYISHYKKKVDKLNYKKKSSAERKNRYFEKSIELDEDLKYYNLIIRKKGEEILQGLEHKTLKKNEVDVRKKLIQRKFSDELHKKGKKMHDRYLKLLEKQKKMKNEMV